ncbi:hypothetical protein IMZ68_03715 [Candidatus Bathyarchaeota archaeon]|nr:hypothetical protein [Candidatus Bathyarchaeota archaeon]
MLTAQMRASAGQEYPIHTLKPGWAEQDPDIWVTAALNCIREAVQQAGIAPCDMAGIGLTGQMHSLVCLDNYGQPVRQAILWAEQRSAEQLHTLTASIGRENLTAWISNPLATGFMFTSWAWLRDHEPCTAANTRWLLLAKDQVRYKLTGVLGSEPNDASNIANRSPLLMVARFF